MEEGRIVVADLGKRLASVPHLRDSAQIARGHRIRYVRQVLRDRRSDEVRRFSFRIGSRLGCEPCRSHGLPAGQQARCDLRRRALESPDQNLHCTHDIVQTGILQRHPPVASLVLQVPVRQERTQSQHKVRDEAKVVHLRALVATAEAAVDLRHQPAHAGLELAGRCEEHEALDGLLASACAD